jgi:hypothetical protein
LDDNAASTLASATERHRLMGAAAPLGAPMSPLWLQPDQIRKLEPLSLSHLQDNLLRIWPLLQIARFRVLQRA